MKAKLAAALTLLAGNHASVHARAWVILGALLGASAVALSAAAAHALANRLDPKSLATLRTAIDIQIWHALALVAAGLLAADTGSRAADWAGLALFTGTLLFSGSLYLHTLAGIRLPLAPAGGLLLIAGWLCLALAALRLP